MADMPPNAGWVKASSMASAIEERDVADILHRVIKSIIEDSSLPIYKRTFAEDKTFPGEQETHLIGGDAAQLIVSSLMYDLHPDSVAMIATNLIRGVSYEYLVEQTQVNMLGIQKLKSAISHEMKMSQAVTNGYVGNLNFYLHEPETYIHNFVILRRPSDSTVDHVAFYFNKSESDDDYIYEIPLDGHNEYTEQLYLAYDRLRVLSVPYTGFPG